MSDSLVFVLLYMMMMSYCFEHGLNWGSVVVVDIGLENLVPKLHEFLVFNLFFHAPGLCAPGYDETEGASPFYTHSTAYSAFCY